MNCDYCGNLAMLNAIHEPGRRYHALCWDRLQDDMRNEMNAEYARSQMEWQDLLGNTEGE